MEKDFLEHNNISIEELNENKCLVKLTIKDESLNPYGIVHGGLIFSLGDTVMGYHAGIKGKNPVTLNASINFLKKGTGKYLIAESKLIKAGKTTCVLTSNIYNDSKKLIANMSATYFFMN